MSDIKNEKQVREFLSEYPNPMIKVSTTIKDGYISCIRPVPTICGPELYCGANIRHIAETLVKQEKKDE